MLFCFNLLKDKAAVMSRPNFDPNKRKPGTKKKLTLWEEFTLVSMRLRLGLLEKDLAERFVLLCPQFLAFAEHGSGL